MESLVDAAVLPVGESGANQGWLEPIGVDWSLLRGLHTSLLCFLSPSHICIPNKLPFSLSMPAFICHPWYNTTPVSLSTQHEVPPLSQPTLCVCVWESQQKDIHWVWHTKGVSLQVEEEILISACMWEYELVYTWSVYLCLQVYPVQGNSQLSYLCALYTLFVLDDNEIKWGLQRDLRLRGTFFFK